MDIGGGIKITSARDVGDALSRVVDHDGEMIARWRILAYEDHVAPALWTCFHSHRTADAIDFRKCQGPAAKHFRRHRDRFVHVEAQAIALAAPFSLRDLGRVQTSMESRIERGTFTGSTPGPSSRLAASISARVAKHG